jgi:hypothetical protein
MAGFVRTGTGVGSTKVAGGVSSPWASVVTSTGLAPVVLAVSSPVDSATSGVDATTRCTSPLFLRLLRWFLVRERCAGVEEAAEGVAVALVAAAAVADTPGVEDSDTVSGCVLVGAAAPATLVLALALVAVVALGEPGDAEPVDFEGRLEG